MKLSAPIYYLKRQAKTLSHDEQIPLHQALDAIAVKEGYERWSSLTAAHSKVTPASRLFSQLEPGDMLLVGARPGQGKTLLCLDLALEAVKHGHNGVFFTLEYNECECRERLRALTNGDELHGLLRFDCSDEISADYIVKSLGSCSPGTLVVIDYLQLLDQSRQTPPLMDQVQALRSFAQNQGAIMVFISQIDRAYDPSTKPCPDLKDVRLPNPLDLSLFDKTCFLNDGEIRFT